MADRSPCLRTLVLQELLKRSDSDSEVQELKKLRESDPVVSHLLALQSSDGSWRETAMEGSVPGGSVQATSQALARLGYLNFDEECPALKRGAEYLFSKQCSDGSWPLPQKGPAEEVTRGSYTMMPLQTALPLHGLAACGYSEDTRSELAYEWLMERRLEEGVWPTGKAGEVYGYVAGYRRLAHSKWGCRSNTTASLICLALHPKRSSSPEARRALDLLLGCETCDKANIGFNVARTIGAEPQGGFITYFARFDLALLLDLCWRIGASHNDVRVADLVDFVAGLQGPYGIWEYTSHPEASRWITFDVLRSLSRLDDSTEWLSMEPRTPFKAYLRRRKRF